MTDKEKKMIIILIIVSILIIGIELIFVNNNKNAMISSDVEESSTSEQGVADETVVSQSKEEAEKALEALKVQSEKEIKEMQEKSEKERKDREEGQYEKQGSDGTKTNVSSKVKEEKKIDGFIIVSNMTITAKDGWTTIKADVENISGSDFTGEQYIDFSLLNKEGQEMTKIKAVVPAAKDGEKVELNVEFTEDYSNAYDYKIEKSK